MSFEIKFIINNDYAKSVDLADLPQDRKDLLRLSRALGSHDCTIEFFTILKQRCDSEATAAERELGLARHQYLCRPYFDLSPAIRVVMSNVLQQRVSRIEAKLAGAIRLGPEIEKAGSFALKFLEYSEDAEATIATGGSESLGT